MGLQFKTSEIYALDWLSEDRLLLQELASSCVEQYPLEVHYPHARYKPDLKWGPFADEMEEVANAIVEEVLEEIATSEIHVLGDFQGRGSNPLLGEPEDIATRVFGVLKFHILTASTSTRGLLTWVAQKSDAEYALETSTSTKTPMRTLIIGNSGIVTWGLWTILREIAAGNGENLPGIFMAWGLLIAAFNGVMSLRMRKVVEQTRSEDIRRNMAKQSRQAAEDAISKFKELNNWYADDFRHMVNEVNALAEATYAKLNARAIAIPAHPFFRSPYDEVAGVTKGRPHLKAPDAMAAHNSRDFEFYCAAWLRTLGATNVEVTEASKDGGVDIVSDQVLAQVKMHSKPVGVKPLREIIGATVGLQADTALFSASGFTRDAIDFAIKHGILLYWVDPVAQIITGCTSQSKAIIDEGWAY